MRIQSRGQRVTRYSPAAPKNELQELSTPTPLRRNVFGELLLLQRLTLLVLFLLSATTLFPPSLYFIQPRKQFHSSTVKQNEIAIENVTCTRVASQKKTNGKPHWIPGYPGSGSEMLRDLVEATTGLEAADVYRDKSVPISCVSPRIITCRTHFPMLNGDFHPLNSTRLQKMSESVILLMRNPAAALPSHFNHIWEVANKVAFHTKQAPEEAWRTFRDKMVVTETLKWVSLITDWHTLNFAMVKEKPQLPSGVPLPKVSMYIAYEDLIAPGTGPPILQNLLQLLHTAGHSIPPEVLESPSTIACLWKQVVLDRPRGKRQSHSYVPGYTVRQKEFILLNLRNLLLHPVVLDHPDLRPLILRYEHEVNYIVRLDEGSW